MISISNDKNCKWCARVYNFRDSGATQLYCSKKCEAEAKAAGK